MPLPRTPAVVLGLVLVIAAAGCAARADPPAAYHPGSASAPGASATATPSATAAPGTPSASAGPTTGRPATPGPAAVAHAFPVQGKVSYAHSHHDYPATDIIAACGLKVVAPVTGTVVVANRVDSWTAKQNLGATRGGLSVSIVGDDGVRYYGSHLRMIVARIQPGARVKAGDQLGEIGDTGDASACHLHFGISPPCRTSGDWWLQRGTVWPWSYLDSWRSGGNRSPVAEVTSWQRQHGCPDKPLVDP